MELMQNVVFVARKYGLRWKFTAGGFLYPLRPITNSISFFIPETSTKLPDASYNWTSIVLVVGFRFVALSG